MTVNKDTTGKLRLNLIPPRAMSSIARVREFGVSKYHEEWAWLDDVNPDDFIEATKRHLLVMQKEGDYSVRDVESNRLHIEHALTSLAMAVEIIMREVENNE